MEFQAAVRGWLVRRRLQHQAMAALVIQTNWRTYLQRRAYRNLKCVLVEFQSVCRGFLIRHQYDYEDMSWMEPLEAYANNLSSFPTKLSAGALLWKGWLVQIIDI